MKQKMKAYNISEGVSFKDLHIRIYIMFVPVFIIVIVDLVLSNKTSPLL